MGIKKIIRKILKKSNAPYTDKAEDYCKALEARYGGQIKIKDLTYLKKIRFS